MITSRAAIYTTFAPSLSTADADIAGVVATIRADIAPALYCCAVKKYLELRYLANTGKQRPAWCYTGNPQVNSPLSDLLDEIPRTAQDSEAARQKAATDPAFTRSARGVVLWRVIEIGEKLSIEGSGDFGGVSGLWWYSRRSTAEALLQLRRRQNPEPADEIGLVEISLDPDLMIDARSSALILPQSAADLAGNVAFIGFSG